MKTHRGINMASIAGEGLAGLAGVIVVVFFLSAGTAFLLRLFAPRFFWSASGWLMPAFLLMGAVACAAYLVGQRRDRQMGARILEELHKLNEASPPSSGASSVADMDTEALQAWHGNLGLAEFNAEELKRAARPSAMSPEALLIMVLGLVFVVGMLDMFTWLEDYEKELIVGFVAIVFGTGIGYVFHRLRVRRDAERVASELDL
jgi:hypothetical protein